MLVRGKVAVCSIRGSNWVKQLLQGWFCCGLIICPDKLCSCADGKCTLACSVGAVMMCTQGGWDCLLCINRHVVFANQNSDN